MSKHDPIQDVIEEIFQSILATPRRQRKLLSKTFWDKFGFKVRTKDRVSQVKDALQQRGIFVNFDETVFGTEDKDEWVVLTYVEPPCPPTLMQQESPTPAIPTPSDDWFQLLAEREFESEREVEYYFIAPILEQIGYKEADFAIGFPVQMYQGVRSVKKEADLVLFNGKSRAKEDALLVVEAKKKKATTAVLHEDAVGQARAYAMWLSTPYYFVTNGEEMRVYLFRGALLPDLMLMTFKRSEFKQNWVDFYQILNREAVVARKEELRKMLSGV